MAAPTVEEQYLLSLVNAARAAEGLAPLAWDTNLDDAADAHSAWMLQTGGFDHVGANGSTPMERIVAAGFTFNGPGGTGENIAAATLDATPTLQDDIDAMFAGWMGSAGHRASILSADFNETGLGLAVDSYPGFGGAESLVGTQTFAYGGQDVPVLTGTIFVDTDEGGDYDIGEGLAGVRVQIRTPDDEIIETVTNAGGGYAIAVPFESPDAPVEVTFLVPDAEPIVEFVTVAEQNVALDVMLDMSEGPGGPGTGDPGTGDPGTGDPGTGDPGTGDPGTGGPGTGDPGTGDPGTGDPGTGDPGTGDPGTGDPGTGDPGTGDPGTGDPGTGDPGTGDPGTGDPGTGDPGTGDPGTGDPGTGEPGTGEPGTGEPGTGEPGGSGVPRTNAVLSSEFSADAFDGLAYIATHADLVAAFGPVGLDAETLEWLGDFHYANYGFQEGRLVEGYLPFDAGEFRANYAGYDVAGMNDADATAFYINIGAVESFLGFDAMAYIASHDDLIGAFGANEAAGVWHYENAGFYEGREVDFDAAQYLENYADLRAAFGDNLALATAHYVTSGHGEGRTDIDALDYIASHADLIAAFGTDDVSARAHYAAFGREEGREVDFDAWQYLQNYDDLRGAFGNDVDLAAMHYIANGFGEGRTDDPLMV